MRLLSVKYICTFLFAFLFTGLSTFPCAARTLLWSSLEPGIESCESVLPLGSYRGKETSVVSVVMLRLNPTMVDFELLMASEQGEARTLEDWASKHELLAAINASMYLPDGLTSTGYMRRDLHANNSRVVNSFGAFFVAMPDSAVLPRAAVLDRQQDNWKELLPHYKIVIQNFRMLSPEGAPLWNSVDRPFSISAVGEDVNGNILFIHSSRPVAVKDFVKGLLTMPLGIKRLMYVEGGHQAAMLVNTPAQKRVWTGKYSPLLQIGGMALLPNVLGVTRKQ
ncbi:MAG: phosphodiester glycosidase family protein [Desulfovibrionaceae bacterium]|nr:phosphodiester glycosidase family protein [Desulfovibrionaceae bacterium]